MKKMFSIAVLAAVVGTAQAQTEAGSSRWGAEVGLGMANVTDMEADMKFSWERWRSL